MAINTNDLAPRVAWLQEKLSPIGAFTSDNQKLSDTRLSQHCDEKREFNDA